MNFSPSRISYALIFCTTLSFQGCDKSTSDKEVQNVKNDIGVENIIVEEEDEVKPVFVNFPERVYTTQRNLPNLSGTITSEQGLQYIEVIVYGGSQQPFSRLINLSGQKKYKFSISNFARENDFSESYIYTVEIYAKTTNGDISTKSIGVLVSANIDSYQLMEKKYLPIGKEIIFGLRNPKNNYAEASIQITSIGNSSRPYDFTLNEVRGWDNRIRKLGVIRNRGVFLLSSQGGSDELNIDFENLVRLGCMLEVPLYITPYFPFSESRVYEVLEGCEIDEFSGLRIRISESSNDNEKQISMLIQQNDDWYLSVINLDDQSVYQIRERASDEAGTFSANRIDEID